MEYEALAEELLRLRASIPRLKVERHISNMLKGEICALNLLAAHGNMAYPKDLSKGMQVSTPRIAAILNHLEHQGLVTRTVDSGDNRQTIVRLTEAGQRQVNEYRTALRTETAKILEFLGQEDAVDYIRLQRKLLQYAENRRDSRLAACAGDSV